MKNIIFEIRYYLLFLVLSVGFFLTLIFNSESSTNSVNENFNSGEIERSNIDLEKFLPLTSEKEQTSNRTHIIYVEKNNTLIEFCLLYTSPSPRDRTRSRMPSSA